MSATFKIGDYVVNSRGSVGIIEGVDRIGYDVKWYNGGVYASVMSCHYSVAERHAEMEDIVRHLPEHMIGTAILEYGKRKQAEEDAKVVAKYGVEEFVISRYPNPFAVGFITEVTPTHYIGQWYVDGEVHLEMKCRHNVIERRATVDEWSVHVPLSILMKKVGLDKTEEETAMTTLEATKVLVTEKEKEALDVYSRIHNGKTVGQLADNFMTQKDKWNDTYVPLREMGIAKFIDAVTKGYEVPEPKIDVGDRVVYIGDGEGFPGVGTVSRFGEKSTSIQTNSSRYVVYTENLRLATEEEITWNELGREVGEFRVGDRFIYNGDICVVSTDFSKSLARNKYVKGLVKGLYPVGTYVDFTKGGKA